MEQEATAPFIIRYTCPYCGNLDELIVSARSRREAALKAVGTGVICTRCFRGYILKHENIRQVIPLRVTPIPKRVIGVEIAEAKRFPDNTVTVKLRHERGEYAILFPKAEVETFDKLMAPVKAIGREKINIAILATLLAHGEGTKSVITGFLLANGYKTDTTTVGEALSRFLEAKHVYSRGTFLDEAIYGIPYNIRLHVLERIRFDPHYQWWKPEVLTIKPAKIIELKKPIEYEWIRASKPIPRFRSAEDYKHYGPYKTGETAKLPLTMAYFLVKTGYAEWLNPQKETVQQAEKIFRFQPIEKIKRQATLIEF